MANSKSANKMKDLVDEVAASANAYSRLRFDRARPPKLGKPCKPAELAKAEKIIGKPLPPSYKAFFELYNGWADFDGDGKILAVEDHRSKWVKERIDTIEMLFGEIDKQSPFEKGAIPVMLGESIENFVVLDPGKLRPNGEMSLISYDSTDKEDTFKDFYAFLQDNLKTNQLLLKQVKRSPKRKAR